MRMSKDLLKSLKKYKGKEMLIKINGFCIPLKQITFQDNYLVFEGKDEYILIGSSNNLIGEVRK